MLPVFPPFALISASLTSNDYRVNAELNNALKTLLEAQGYTVLDVEGVFHGIPEPSLLVFNLDERSALAIARDYRQTHILMVDQMRHSNLVATLDQSREYIGVFKELENTEGDGSWINGRFYSCVKE